MPHQQSLVCTWIWDVGKPGFAVCTQCGFSDDVKQMDLSRVHRFCDAAPPEAIRAYLATLPKPDAIEFTSPSTAGPGTELAELLDVLGLEATASCQCESRKWQMNSWGIQGCKDNREQIVGWLREEEKKASWGEWLQAGRKAASLGIYSIGALVDEAIRRAEAKGSLTTSCPS